MGVRHLETLMKKFVPGGFVPVSLIEACLKFKNENNELPILIVDFMGLVTVLTSDFEWTLCGGRYNKFREILEELLTKLSEHAKLVFFKDGPVVDQKLSTWIRRHSEKYHEAFGLMQKIYNGDSLKEVIEADRKDREIPRLAPKEMMENIARKYGEVRVTFTRECDSEIARYAHNNSKVLAIIADDSDFLIYPNSGHWRYFSLRNINLATLETFEFSRPALRNYLNVNDKELVIVSTLNGNDIIKFEKVRDNFHVKMDSFKHRFADFRFLKLAECARNISHLPDDKMIAKIHKFIGFGTEELVKNSFEMYNPVFDIVELTDDLHKFCRDNYFMFTYAILLNSPITFNVSYFDLSINDDIHDAKVELFEKQIGVILANMPERRSIGYEIVTKKTHFEDYRSHWVQPKKFDDIPPLIELLDRSQFPEHDEIRLKLLKYMIGPIRLKNYDFRTFPMNYLHDILTLVTLRHYKFIAQFEADLILLTIKHVETNTIPEDLQVPSVLNEKALRTSFLFSKFHMYIDRCFQVTGLSLTMAKVINYDGVLFHSLYLKYLEHPFDIPQLLGPIRQYRIYR